jgi:hypothetical protein
MPDTITYLVNMPGAEFNRYLNPIYRLPQSYFDERTSGDPDYREARLQDDDCLVGIDLTGVWTEICLRIGYGALLEHEPWRSVEKFRSEIQDWERKLRALAPTTEIHRVATSFFRRWEAANDSPIYDHRDMRRFFDWLAMQEESELYSRRLLEV